MPPEPPPDFSEAQRLVRSIEELCKALGATEDSKAQAAAVELATIAREVRENLKRSRGTRDDRD